MLQDHLCPKKPEILSYYSLNFYPNHHENHHPHLLSYDRKNHIDELSHVYGSYATKT